MVFRRRPSVLQIAGLGLMCVACSADPVNAQDNGTMDLSLVTDDVVTIRATLGVPAGAESALPAVILIHQGGSDRTEWDGFFGKLLAENYIVLAYDVRGHGESDSVDSISQLFNDPDLAPNDLRAALDYLRVLKGVDANRIAVVGASIGANLAGVASSELGIKTAVAISGKTSAVRNLAGADSLSLQSVFYISSAGDQGGQRAEWAREMFELTAGPRAVEIVEGSSAHGVSIFADDPELETKILTWLETHL